MNVYDLLRRLITVAAHMSQEEKSMWASLVNDLQARNAFGTLTTAMTVDPNEGK